MNTRENPIDVLEDEPFFVPGVDTPHSPPDNAAWLAQVAADQAAEDELREDLIQPDDDEEPAAAAAVFIVLPILIWEVVLHNVHVPREAYAGLQYVELYNGMALAIAEPSQMALFHVFSFFPALRRHMAGLTSALQSRNSATWEEVPEVVAIRMTLVQLTEIMADIGRVFAFVSAQISSHFNNGPGADLVPEAAAVFADVSDVEDDDNGLQPGGFVGSDEEDGLSGDDPLDSDFDPMSD